MSVEFEAIRSHLLTLELEVGVTLDDVKKAYRELCMIHHPDRHPENLKVRSEAKMRQLNAAYEFLRNHPELLTKNGVRSECGSNTQNPAGRGFVTVRRMNQRAGKWRSMQMMIDGVVVGKIGNNQLLSFPLASSKHTLQIKMDWCLSRPIEIALQPNQELRLKCGTFAEGTNGLTMTQMILTEYGYLFLQSED